MYIRCIACTRVAVVKKQTKISYILVRDTEDKVTVVKEKAEEKYLDGRELKF